MTDLPVRRFTCPDGVELAWREVGSGRPFVLLHGLMGSGALLAGQGLVPALAERGYRVVLPDLRGHGDSGRPHDPACYPPDILADDMLALIGHLGLGDYDLGGYSMGGRLVLRLLARGARPARAVVGGQGLDALDAESRRTGGHRRVLAAVAAGAALPAGSPEEAMADWIRQSGADARAVGLVLGTFVATPADALRPVPVPTLVVAGDRDSRGTSAGSLAALLPHGRLVLVPGDHFTAPGAPEFATAVLEFLARPLPANASRFPGDDDCLPAFAGGSRAEQGHPAGVRGTAKIASPVPNFQRAQTHSYLQSGFGCLRCSHRGCCVCLLLRRECVTWTMSPPQSLSKPLVSMLFSEQSGYYVGTVQLHVYAAGVRAGRGVGGRAPDNNRCACLNR